MPAGSAPLLHRPAGWSSLRQVDFPAALSAPVQSSSPHFVLHHLAATPHHSAKHGPQPGLGKISTAAAPSQGASVDILQEMNGWWLGLVIPKRHARRAVTRNLLRRQIREEARARRDHLAPGQWVIRLRAPFDARRFPSAASAELRLAARRELEQVFARAVSP